MRKDREKERAQKFKEAHGMKGGGKGAKRLALTAGPVEASPAKAARIEDVD